MSPLSAIIPPARHPRTALLLLVTALLAVSGCAAPQRGMMGSTVYFSDTSPNIKISVRDGFRYRQGEQGEYQHQFIDETKHRMVFLHHEPHDPGKPNVEQYLAPEYWMYATSPQITDIDRFTERLLGEKWYVHDYVDHVSSDSCFMVRKKSTITSTHDLFHILYYWRIPSYKCRKWAQPDPLSGDQKEFLDEFHAGFSEDLTLSRFSGE